jgi:hypothetical protein
LSLFNLAFIHISHIFSQFKKTFFPYF